MKRIVLNTGDMALGFWKDDKFEYKLKSKLVSLEYGIDEDMFVTELEKAKKFIVNNGGSLDDIEIYDPVSGQQVFIFDTEDADEVIKDSPADRFLIYLETNSKNLIICTAGFRNGAFPTSEFPLPGDYKIFTKANLKNGFLSAKQEFEKNNQSKGAIKLRIYPLDPEQI